MQTQCFIPATFPRPTPTRLGGGSISYAHTDQPCTIVAFVGIAGIDGNHVRSGAFTDVQAVAFWPTGEMFTDSVRRFKVQPQADFAPALEESNAAVG